MVTAALPVELNVTVLVATVFSATRPNEMLVVLSVRVGVEGPSWILKVFETPPAVAVNVAVCAALTVDTVVVNPMLDAFAGTVTVAGTATAALLLERFTVIPPLTAFELSATVQASVPAPVIDPLLQESAFNAGVPCATPVPLRPISAVALTDESLTIINWPATAPVLAGSNCTFTTTVAPGFIKIGRPITGIENPVPESVASPTVTGAVPVEVRVRDLVAAVLTPTSPNETLVELRLSTATYGFNCRLTFDDALLVLAVSVTVWAEVTADTSAINAALVEFSGIVTAVVLATAGLLLDKETLIPPLGAAVLLVTMQLSVPGPVKVVLLHERVRVAACEPWAAFLPVPCNLTVVVEVVEDFSVTRLATELLDPEPLTGLLMMVTSPLVVPESFGLKCTLMSSELPAARVMGRFPIPSIENESDETVI